MNSRTTVWILAGLLLMAVLLGALWLLSGDEVEHAVPAVVSADDAVHPPGVLPAAVGPAPGSAAAAAPRTAPVPLATAGPVTALTGTVVDAAGLPVAGANVQVFFSEGALPLQPRETAGPPVLSEDDGHFRIVGVPESRALGVEISHADHATALKQPFGAVVGTPTELGVIVLQPGLLLTGRVIDEGGRPLEGARITLSDMTALVAPDADGPVIREAFSDADGHYQLPHLSMRRQFALTATLDGYATLRTVLSFVLDLPGDSWNQDFTLESAGQVLGGVVLDDQGRPVPDVSLTISRRKRGSNAYFQQEQTTGPNGRFLFDGVPDDTFDLRVVAPYAYLSSAPKLAAGMTNHEVWLMPALAMHGRLTGASELPNRFTVKALPDARTGALLVPGADAVREFEGADPPGTFRFDGLKPGTWFFEVSAPGFAVTKSSSLILGENAPDPELLIHMFRGGDIIGRLDKPVAGVPVELRPGGYDPALSIEGIFPTRPVHGLATVTGADGSFRLAHVPEEVYTVSLKPPGAPALHVSAVEVREGGVQDLGLLNLPAACAVSGRVTWTDDELKPPFKVTASGASSYQNTLTDETGAFQLGALQPGDYKLTATPQGFFEAIRFRGDAEVTLKADEQREVVIDLRHSLPATKRPAGGG